MPAQTRKPTADKPAETTPAAPAAETTPAAPAAETPRPANFFDAATLAAIRSAPAWMPLDGETVTGELIAVVKRKHTEHGDYPMVVLKPVTDESGKFLTIHAYHDDIPADLKSVGVKRGDQVTFVYASKRSAKRLGKDNASFSVVPANGGELDVYDF